MMREEYGYSDPEGDMVPPSWTGVIEVGKFAFEPLRRYWQFVSCNRRP